MLITCSIVTYNSENEISKILHDLENCLSIGLDSVYVVDNNSTDNTCNLIKNKFGWVNLIESKKNLGYGGGHNLAIRQVDSDFHIIINPDISIDVENFVKIKEFCMSEKFAIACPKVMNSDGTEQFLPKKDPKFKYILGGTFKFLKKYREEYTLFNIKPTNITEVEFCTGCFTICNTKILKQIGGYDERYFMYMEDADLTRTMRNEGKALYNPNIIVTHLWKRENRKNIKGIVRWFKSYFKYKKKWRKNNASKL